MSAVTKAASLGVVLVLGGVAFLEPSWPAVVKVLIAIGLQLLTAPVAGFALGRATYRAGTPLSTATRYDELGDAIERAGELRPIAPPSDQGRI
jgi:multicomponent Na+:H+ antiporter subunit G